MLGQLLLLITIFQKQPNKILTYCSIAALGLLLVLILLIGLMSWNYKMICSTLSFVIVAVLVIKSANQPKKQ